MKDICNKLLETYDSRYLDRLDLKSQRVWNDITRKILNSKNPFIKNSSNLVLSRLVQNHFNKNKPKTDLLSGPMSLSLHKSEKYNMNIYIFGEIHGLKNDCKKFIKEGGKECIKPCTKKQICNPKTGRCVSKSGKIAKNIKVNNNMKIKQTYIYSSYVVKLYNRYYFDIFSDENKQFRDFDSKYKDKLYNFFITENNLQNYFESLVTGFKILKLDFDKNSNKIIIIFETEYLLSDIEIKDIIKHMSNSDVNCKTLEINGDCLEFVKGTIYKYSKDNKFNELELQDYFKKLVNNTNVFLDIYVEVPQFFQDYYINYSKGNYKKNNYLKKIFYDFLDCIQTETRFNNNECHLFRFHYIDIRKTDEIKPDLIIENVLKDFDDKILGSKTKKFLKELTNTNSKKLYKIYENDIKDNYYIQKELSKTPLKNEILKHCNKRAKKIISKYNLENIKNFAKILLNKGYSEEYTRLIELLLTYLGGLAVDVYTLSRLFRTKFSNTKFQPNKQYNIIMYAGDAHSKVYRTFLNKLGFNQIQKNKTDNIKKDRRCIDFKDIIMFE